MNEKHGNEITRDRIEKMLMEATGFRGDIAAIDAVMVVVEAWAAQMAEGLAIAPNAVREAHLHLLVQQAELLLDSGGRIAQAAQLAEHVTFLTGLTDGMQMRSQELADKMAEISGQAGIGMAERAMAAMEISLAPPEPTATETLKSYLTGDDGSMPPWERELIEKQLADREAAGEITRMTEGWDDQDPDIAVLAQHERDTLAEWEASLLADSKPAAKPKASRAGRGKAPAIESTPDGPVLQCTGCGKRKPATRENYFANSKSPTGLESKCRACRSASRAA